MPSAAVEQEGGRNVAEMHAGLEVTYVGFLLGHGGDALQMLWLAAGMRDRGADVRIIVPAVTQSVSMQERCDALGIACERSDLIRVSMESSHQRLGSLLRLFRSIDTPVVHFHSGNSVLPRMAMIALETLRFRPSLVTLQSPYETVEPGGPRARFWAATARRRFAAVVSPSDHAARFQRQCGLPAEMTPTIRNAIDVERMASGDAAAPLEELGLGDDAQVVLFCSRLDGQKRPVDAVRIFREVAEEFPRAHLVIVGNGDLECDTRAETARLGLEHRVRFVGYRTDVPDWLAAASVWLLPTERENFSVAVLEAMAAGAPVLSTWCPGNDEILVSDRNAVTFAPGDIYGGAVGLRRLLADPSLRDRLRSQAARDVRAFTIEHMVDEYGALYRTHLERLERRGSPRISRPTVPLVM